MKNSIHFCIFKKQSLKIKGMTHLQSVVFLFFSLTFPSPISQVPYFHPECLVRMVVSSSRFLWGPQRGHGGGWGLCNGMDHPLLEERCQQSITVDGVPSLPSPLLSVSGWPRLVSMLGEFPSLDTRDLSP